MMGWPKPGEFCSGGLNPGSRNGFDLDVSFLELGFVWIAGTQGHFQVFEAVTSWPVSSLPLP
jgi:hypothetical protein